MKLLRIVVPLAAAVALAATLPALAGERPITDFTSQQGAWCPAFDDDGFLHCDASYYMPDNSTACPGGTFTFPFDEWTDPKKGLDAVVDATGDVNRLAGVPFVPTITGSVFEVGLGDGRADVGVVLHSTGAWMRVLDANFEFVFGHGVGEVLAGATPTLGDALLQIRFTNTAPNARLPDMSQVAYCPKPGQTFELLSLRARANGPLRPASGYPDGTPGRLEVTQTCLLATTSIADGNSRLALDACPAESVIVRPVGQ